MVKGPNVRSIVIALIVLLLVPAAAFAASPAPAPAPRPAPAPAPAPRPAAPAPSAPKPAPSSGARPVSGTPSAKATPVQGTKSAPKPTAVRPSTGAKQQPAPAAKLLPKTAPPKLGRSFIPSGHSYGRDRVYLIGHPAYLDPYSALYYGNPASPYYYMYAAGLQSGQQPVAWQYHGHRHGGVAAWLVVVIALVAFFVGLGLGLLFRA
jgi:hypothetical protein